MPRHGYETLLKFATVYFDHEKKGLQSTWKQIYEEVGAPYYHGNQGKLAKELAKTFQRPFPSLNHKNRPDKPHRLPFGTEVYDPGDCEIIYFTDCHFWPFEHVEPSDSFTLLLEYLKEKVQYCNKHKKKLLVICGGDAFDGTTVSRYPKAGWIDLPSVAEELEACKWYMGEIYKVASKCKDVEFFWIWGNHDERFDRLLANQAGMFEGVDGFSLVEHFPDWQFCQSLFLNNEYLFIHDIHGGKHAAYNNARTAATHVFTGHTHRLHSRRVDFYKHHAIAIEGGTLANKASPCFGYVKGNPLDWQEGFVTASIDNGRFAHQLVYVDRGMGYVDGYWWEVA